MRLRLLFVLLVTVVVPRCWAQTEGQHQLKLDLQVGGQYAYAEGGHFSGETRPFKQHHFILKFWPGALVRYQASPRVALSTGYTGGAAGWGYTIKMPDALTRNPFGGSNSGGATAVYVDRIPLLLDFRLKSFDFQPAAGTDLYTYSIKVSLTAGLGAVRVHNFTINKLTLGPAFGNDTIDFKEADPYIANRWGAYVTTGATARFYRLGKERFNLGIYLNQGFTDLIRAGVDYEYNGRRGYHLFRSRGSGIGFTVGLPIHLATF